jgi:hypothetical protein
MSKPKLKLEGEDGNAFAIIGRAVAVAKKAGWSKEKIEEYRANAMSGDYDNLIVVTLKSFDVDFGYEDIESSDDELDSEMCDECGNTLLFCTCELDGE